MNYSQKLKDPRWQKKRLEILQRDEFKCCYCNDEKTELQIHHLKYRKEPWDVDNQHLITLCKDCHSFITYNKNIDVIRIIKQITDDAVLNFYVKCRIGNEFYIGIFDCREKDHIWKLKIKCNSYPMNNLINLYNG